jgi:DNA-directed RNA polymerase subunit M/transcription elongation factor TFIIS
MKPTEYEKPVTMRKQTNRSVEYHAIIECLDNYPRFQELPRGAVLHLARLLERSVYNSAIDKAKEKGIPTNWDKDNFVAQYSSIGYTLKINLDITSSVNRDKEEEVKEYVASRLFNYIVLQYAYVLVRHLGWLEEPHLAKTWETVLNYSTYFDPRRVGGYSAQELNPLINSDYVKTLVLRTQQETKVKTSSMYLCVCGERKTICYEIQTRSLDEGGTLFIKCVCCGKVWRSRY